MFEGMYWRRIFVDLGWAMAAVDPLCCWYYLAYRAQGAGPGPAGEIGERRVFTHRPMFENRAPSKLFVTSKVRNA
jgi:hypothetical protein